MLLLYLHTKSLKRKRQNGLTNTEKKQYMKNSHAKLLHVKFLTAHG